MLALWLIVTSQCPRTFTRENGLKDSVWFMDMIIISLVCDDRIGAISSINMEWFLHLKCNQLAEVYMIKMVLMNNYVIGIRLSFVSDVIDKLKLLISIEKINIISHCKLPGMYQNAELNLFFQRSYTKLWIDIHISVWGTRYFGIFVSARQLDESV